MIERERKVDLSTLSPEEFKDLEIRLGEKVRQICDEACEKANKLLNIYGLSTKMQIVIDNGDLSKESTPKSLIETTIPPKKKRGRPRKVATNL